MHFNVFIYQNYVKIPLAFKHHKNNININNNIFSQLLTFS